MQPKLTNSTLNLQISGDAEKAGFKFIVKTKPEYVAKFKEQKGVGLLSPQKLFESAQKFCLETVMEKEEETKAQITTLTDADVKKNKVPKSEWWDAYDGTEGFYNSGCAKGLLTASKSAFPKLTNAITISPQDFAKLLK